MTRRAGGGGGGYYVVIIQEVMGIHADLETDLANKDFNKILAPGFVFSTRIQIQAASHNANQVSQWYSTYPLNASWNMDSFLCDSAAAIFKL